MSPQEIVNLAVKMIDEKNGKDIMVLDVMELTSLGDYLIIATANNTTQVRAIANFVEDTLREAGEQPLHTEQKERGSKWILIDYGAVMVHIFYKETRDFYSLETLWSDAKRQDVQAILSSKK